MLVIILHTLLYIKNKSKQGRKGKSANGTEERRGTGQRMPPPSSPVPRLSSVPSAASPSEPSPALNTSPSHRESGRAGTLPRLWVMLSPPPRHRSTSNKQRGRASGCLSSCRLSLASCCLLLPLCLPRSLVPLFVLISSARSCLTFCPPSCRLSPPLPRW